MRQFVGSVKGFTLLELLAAMVLLALIMLGVWSGLHTATHTARHGRAKVDHLDAIRGAEQFLRRNFSQVSPIPWARDRQRQPRVFVADAHHMRFVAPLPGFLGRMGPQLQMLELVPDGQGLWRLQVAFALLPPDGSRPRPFGQPQVLLAGIRDGQFAYRGYDVTWKDTGWQGAWSRPSQMPAMVRIRLSLAQGSWPTFTAPLRVDASAVNRASVRTPLWRGDKR